MKPGLHRHIPFDAYLKIDARSRSEIMRLDNPAKALLQAQLQQAPTDAMRFGSAMHAALLEPDVFEETYAQEPAEFKGGRKGGDGPRATWRREQIAAGKTILDYGQVADVHRAVRQFKACEDPTIKAIMSDVGGAEGTVVWEDEQTGEMLKVRPDYWSSNELVLADIKTAKSAHPLDFERDVFRYGYHAQAAMYLDGWKAATGKEATWVWVVQEKDEYGLVCAHTASPKTIQAGRTAYQSRLRILIQCRESGVWPGYPSTAIEPPPWWTDPIAEMRIRSAPKEPF